MATPSLVWAYFKRKEGNKDVGICNTCNESFQVKNGNTSSLERHLKAMHKNLYPEFEAMKKVREERKRKRKPDIPSGMSSIAT
jgi:hypothetical protein